MASLPDKLDLALVKRLREVVGGAPAIESELRTLADQAGGWARATEAQLRAAERRLAKLNADPTSELGKMATEIRRVETLSGELDEARDRDHADEEADAERHPTCEDAPRLGGEGLEHVRLRAVGHQDP